MKTVMDKEYTCDDFWSITEDVNDCIEGDGVDRDDFGEPYGKVRVIIKYENDEVKE